jgi:hypothetical protein
VYQIDNCLLQDRQPQAPFIDHGGGL